MRILVVEDDLALSEQLVVDLHKAGYVADAVADGVEAEFMGREEPYDLVVLDLGLPKMPGLEVLKKWRAAGNNVPVIILTARDAWHEKVDGIKAGADDYMAKPFHVEELLVRIQAVIRRLKGQAGSELSVAGLQLDEERQVVTTAQGAQVELTGTEFRLLRYLMLNPGKLLSKSHLTEHVYEYNSDKDSNVIEVYVNRLRQKLGKEVIETRRGQGYIFGAKQA